MFSFVESFRIAAEAILANKLRSFLTVLGNIVAVTSIIAVVGLIQGMNSRVTETLLGEADADSFLVRRVGILTDEEEADRARRLNPLIRLEEAEVIRRFAPAVTAVMARALRRGAVSYREKTLESATIQGVTGGYLRFSGYDVERGRLITAAEIRRRRPVAVLGWETADRLFGSESPLDRTVKIEGAHFRVVGVSRKKGAIWGQSQDEFAIIPLGAYQKIYGARPDLSLMVKPRRPELLARAMEQASSALRVERRLHPRAPDDFGILTSDALLDIWHRATDGIFAVLVGVVALSLVVGGIVIMNIMLMVVTERTREIGLRKALGARRRDVRLQFLVESILLSTLGGVAGTALGCAAAWLIAAATPVPARIELWSVGLGVAMTGVVGLVFGLYPASRAARLAPVEAMRKE